MLEDVDPAPGLLHLLQLGGQPGQLVGGVSGVEVSRLVGWDYLGWGTSHRFRLLQKLLLMAITLRLGST